MYPRGLLYTTLGLTICLLCQSSFQCPGKNNTARSPTKLHHDAGVSVLAPTSLVQPTARASNLRHRGTPTGSTNLPSMGPSLNDLADYVRFLDKELKTGRSIKKYFNQVEQCLDKDSKFLTLNASVKTLLTTVVHNKPSLPTLPGEIWDADKLHTHFIDLPDNSLMTNIQLSKKCIVLLMLASGHRKADLMALDVSPNFMKKTKHTFYCAMSKWSKGNKEGKNNFMQFIKFHKFDAQPKICPYRVLQDYIARVQAPLAAQPGFQ